MSNSAFSKAALRGPASRPLLGGICAATLAFAVTKLALALFGMAPAPPPKSTAGLPNFMLSNFRWVAIQGLDAHAIGGTPAIAGGPILQTVATRDAGRHSLAAEVSGLDRNHPYRIAIWVKSEAGANLEIEAGDHANVHASYGVGMFNLATHAAGGTKEAKPGITGGPEGWQKAWLELPTATGRLSFALYILKGGETQFLGDGKKGITIGGISIEKADP